MESDKWSFVQIKTWFEYLNIRAIDWNLKPCCYAASMLTGYWLCDYSMQFLSWGPKQWSTIHSFLQLCSICLFLCVNVVVWLKIPCKWWCLVLLPTAIRILMKHSCCLGEVSVQAWIGGNRKRCMSPKYLYLMFSAFLCGANIFSGLVKINCFSKTFS